MIGENFHISVRGINLHIQETEWIPNRINSSNIIKTWKLKKSKKTLKAAIEKQYIAVGKDEFDFILKIIKESQNFIQFIFSDFSK